MNFTKLLEDNDLSLDLTPIVDVVFNLLIFFALSLNFSQITSSLNIKLPKAGSSEVITDKQIVVSIEKGNKIYSSDIGPGNCLIDKWIRSNSDKNYDDNGFIAKSGKVNKLILDKFLDNFYKKNI